MKMIHFDKIDAEQIEFGCDSDEETHPDLLYRNRVWVWALVNRRSIATLQGGNGGLEVGQITCL
jgi:hypothetical protein